MGIQQHFLKHVSHELKTPLTVLIGDIEIALHQDRSNLKYKEILASLKNEALHLKSILDSLLMLSSLEIPENQQMKQLRVDEVLWDILDKKKIEYPETMVSIVFKSVEDLQQLLLVKGNRDLLFVAFSNLIDNAIKFSNSAPITVTAESVSQKLVISVIDKGIGMSPNEQVNIFKLFYRNSTHMNIGGHGIGLYLTKQILDMHHVDLHLDSVPGHGTTFKLSFPAQF
nr:HAMP domain-containing sensor histidine kinase [Pedobacter sp. ASV28]